MIRRLLLALLCAPVLLHAQNFDTVTVVAQPLRGGVYMLTGSGGNIGLSVGDDAAFLVDDQFAPLTPKILAAVAALTPKPVRFVVNTHWHSDHSGGNENLGKAGAVLVAHDNARRRMSTDQVIEFFRRSVPASPPGALPSLTFTDSVTFHINGDALVAYHVPHAHTDGDVLVHFTRADVIHMGDTFFTVGYPFVDLSSGGNMRGLVRAADRALAVCTPNTIVIPGHGAHTTCDGLRRWRGMLATVLERVQAEMARGRTLEQIQAANLTAEWDAQWGKAFISPAAFVELTYRSLAAR